MRRPAARSSLGTRQSGACELAVDSGIPGECTSDFHGQSMYACLNYLRIFSSDLTLRRGLLDWSNKHCNPKMLHLWLPFRCRLFGRFIQWPRILLFSIFIAHSEEEKKWNRFNCSFVVVSALARHANYLQINLLVISKLLCFLELCHTCSHPQSWDRISGNNGD